LNKEEDSIYESILPKVSEEKKEEDLLSLILSMRCLKLLAIRHYSITLNYYHIFYVKNNWRRRRGKRRRRGRRGRRRRRKRMRRGKRKRGRRRRRKRRRGRRR
jgi:hypothetical protein